MHKLLCHLQVFNMLSFLSLHVYIVAEFGWVFDFLKEVSICTKVLYFSLSKYKYYLVIHFQCVLKIELNKQEWKWFCHKQRLLHWPWLVTLLHYMVGFYTWMLLVHFRGTWSSIKLFFLLWYINKLNGLKVW